MFQVNLSSTYYSFAAKAKQARRIRKSLNDDPLPIKSLQVTAPQQIKKNSSVKSLCMNIWAQQRHIPVAFFSLMRIYVK